jgi:16S rRNA (uracil1498-N3)-methyltransferase
LYFAILYDIMQKNSKGDYIMTRFFVDPSEMCQDYIRLTGENAAHAKVLRLKIGEEVLVCDGNGEECLCSVEDVSGADYLLTVEERSASTSEASVLVSVYMAFSKGDKLEHVIQKATELGAYEIVTFPTARCISKPDEKSIAKKLDRWQKIAASAAEQSGRGRVPKVTVLGGYKEALSHAAKADLAILFYENERGYTLRNALSEAPYKRISLMTGPEGGLEQKEVEMASEAGLRICTLGRRILRCETAPLCALSAVMYDSGEF